MTTIVLQLLVQIILILVNAFFAATEIAVISLNANKLRRLEEEGDKLAPKLLRMVEDSSGFLSTIQIAITLSGFLGSAFAADSFSEYLVEWVTGLGVTALPVSVLDTISVVVITVILSYFTLVFGELVPKRIAMQKPMEMARLSCRVVSAIAVIAKPVVNLLSLSTNGVLRLLHMKTDVEEEQVTEDEIRMMIDLGNENGTIDTEEKELLHNVFDFSDQAVEDVMTRAADVVTLWADTTREEALETIRTSGLSRFPVCGEDTNDVVGVLYARDLLLDLAAQGSRSISQLMRPPYLVPESLSAGDLLQDMQRQKIHLAVVMDEYGGLAGVVTVEDLLEEIVGNIYDEFDPAEPPELEQIGEDMWRVSGAPGVEELGETLGIEFPEDADYDTVGGMVLSCLRTIPKDGSRPSVRVNGLDIQVEKVADHRIQSALVRRAVT